MKKGTKGQILDKPLDMKKHTKLVMTLLVRNEEDIVRYTIEHHLRAGVDFIIATDNGSTDSTRTILREYEEKGILRLIDEPAHNHDQAEWNNRMAKMARDEYGADFIFHCDADEFWCPRSGNLKDEISQRPEDILVVDVVNVLLQDKGGEEAFPKDTKFAVVKPIIPKDYQEETEHKNLLYFKSLPKVVFKLIKKLLFVAEGNHYVTNKDERITEGKAHDILIYHYPIRSRERFFKKVIMSGSAYEQNDKLDKSMGFHVRRWYARYKEGLLDEEYKKLIIQEGDIDNLMREGFIEEIDFNNIILGNEDKNDEWRFFNRKFEYEDKFQDFYWSWAGHKRFGYDLIRNIKPQTIVELGTHKGTSFFSFCQAVKDAHYDANLYAIDTWCGDVHAGLYDENVFKEVIEIKEKYYGGLKIELLRKTFDEAVGEFDHNSIDLLHIDGLHTYEAVKHDFESWFPKVKNNGVILLHDIFISRDDFGVYKFWEALKSKYGTIEFYQSYGLGVVFKDSTRYQNLIAREREWQIRYSYIAEDKKNEEMSTLSVSFEKSLADRDKQIVSQSQAIAEALRTIEEIRQSTSWRLTAPMRYVSSKLNNLFSALTILPSIVRYGGGITGSMKKAWRVFAREGWTGVKRRILFVGGNQSDLVAAIEGCTSKSAVSDKTPIIPRIEFDQTITTYVKFKKNKPINPLVKLIAFYLPQFHPIPENDEWWGKGFTEWTNVKSAKPQFVGHYQPRIPGELGYYNLLDPSVQRRQVELAKLYGIGGFCFYFYWFTGKCLLEKPIKNYLKDKTLDLPFCLCWANENWTRRWDGREEDILISQHHTPEDDLAFIQYVAQYMRDPRYIRINGKPLLLVYRPSLLPSARKTAKKWRNWCRVNGIGEIYLAYTQSFEAVNPAKYGFDAAVEFPPNNSGPPNITGSVTPLKNNFDGFVLDWRVFVKRSDKYEQSHYKLFRGVCPSWDNTARLKNQSRVFVNNTPALYQRWLENAINHTVRHQSNPDERLVFINAWNEWAEGAYLEPDLRYGYAWLEATRCALDKQKMPEALGE